MGGGARSGASVDLRGRGGVGRAGARLHRSEPVQRLLHARRQGTYVKHKIGRALAGLGVTDPEPYILDSHALQANPAYGKGLAAAQELYERDAHFRTACLRASRWVLDAREPIDGQPVDHLRLHRAVRYFLAELPCSPTPSAS